MKIALVTFAACMMCFYAGCANPEVVQMSPGLYELGRADHGGIFGNKDALKSSVIRDANKFAEEKGKVAVPVSAKEHPVGILGDWASYEYVFKVVDKNSPEARTPTFLVRADSVRDGGFTSLGSKDTLYIAKPSVESEETHQSRLGNDKSDAPSPSGSALPLAPDATRSTADRLLELKKLFDAGVLTKEEYDAKRKLLVEKL